MDNNRRTYSYIWGVALAAFAFAGGRAYERNQIKDCRQSERSIENIEEMIPKGASAVHFSSRSGHKYIIERDRNGAIKVYRTDLPNNEVR